MASEYLDPDALRALINETEKFKESLDDNLNGLQAAMEECDSAMGSGVIIQKYLAKMEQGVNSLKNTQEKAGEIIAKLQADLDKARGVIEQIG